jgi:hypothetical protein
LCMMGPEGLHCDRKSSAELDKGGVNALFLENGMEYRRE